LLTESTLGKMSSRISNVWSRDIRNWTSSGLITRKDPLRKLDTLDRVTVSRIRIVSALRRKPLPDTASEIRRSHGIQRLVAEVSETEIDVLRRSSVRLRSRTTRTNAGRTGWRTRTRKFVSHLIITGQGSRRDFAILVKPVIAGAAGEPITLRPIANRRDATSAQHLSGVAWCIMRVSATLLATLVLDVDVVVVTPELVVVAPVDAGAAAIEGYGWRRVKVLWTPALPIY
jgi:hypothetical protein